MTKRKAKPKQPKAPAGKGHKRPTLDRDAYARARAEGLTRSESAKAAGSKAKTQSSLCTVAAMLEREDGMYPRIVLERERVIRGMEDVWGKSKARMEQLLDHPNWQARVKTADFFAKIHGGYAPSKVEHSGSIESTPTGAIAELSAEGRATLRALLKQERKRRKARS